MREYGVSHYSSSELERAIEETRTRNQIYDPIHARIWLNSKGYTYSQYCYTLSRSSDGTISLDRIYGWNREQLEGQAEADISALAMELPGNPIQGGKDA